MSIQFTLFLVGCICLSCVAPFADAIEEAASYRLPLIVQPINYKISLKPYLSESDSRRFTFDGECYVEIQAAQNTSEIQLHIKNLNISVSEYYRKNSTARTKLPDVKPNTLTDIVVYKLNESLQANVPYILHYVYTGSMDDDMQGFYRSYYTTSENVTKWLGATEFELNHARRVFPSFDEPKFKATFDLSLTHHRSLKSTGPTRIIKTMSDGEYITDVYTTTPKMSTYILAFMVSEFSDRFDGQFGVLVRPEYYSQTEYCFDIGKKILKALDNYLGIPYYSMGNDKMHLAAIPDFAAGAMENWGLLMYKETNLLYDDTQSTLDAKKRIACIVAHEQSHMWFGNLVTCDWWSYTWLKEGFGTYFQYFAAHLVESDMNLDQQFVVDIVQKVMKTDSTNDVTPMSNKDTNTYEDSEAMFNSISYNKGATFIRMTKHILGEDKFQISLNEYLRTHQYTAITPSDLYTIWKKYWPSKFVRYADSYFDSFTTQVGLPVVTFSRTSSTSVQISQKRFISKDFDSVDTNLWYTVPITYTTSDAKDFQNVSTKFFLQKRPVSISVSYKTTWILGNIQETGYYRVNYDNHTWSKIRQALYADNWDNIHELNRAQIVDDLFNLARAGEIDYGMAFSVIEYLETETSYLPWVSAFKSFSDLSIRLGTETHYFASFIRHITKKAYDKFGFVGKENDTLFDIYTRTIILDLACKFGKGKCITKAKSYFNENLKTNPVPTNLRSVVYCTALREGGEKDFHKLYNKYKTETVATEITLILSSLGCVKDSKLVSRYFHMIISTDIRRQDKTVALSSLYANNNENVEPVFDLMDQNVEQLSNALGDYYSVALVVKAMADRFTTQAQLEKVKAFNEKHKSKFGSSIAILQNAVKSIERNLDWSKAKLESIESYLKNYGKTRKTISVII